MRSGETCPQLSTFRSVLEIVSCSLSLHINGSWVWQQGSRKAPFPLFHWQILRSAPSLVQQHMKSVHCGLFVAFWSVVEGYISR